MAESVHVHLLAGCTLLGRHVTCIDNPGRHGFSQGYGWVADQFGVPWQLNLA